VVAAAQRSPTENPRVGDGSPSSTFPFATLNGVCAIGVFGAKTPAVCPHEAIIFELVMLMECLLTPLI
jgi:hypothetical protein